MPVATAISHDPPSDFRAPFPATPPEGRLQRCLPPDLPNTWLKSLGRQPSKSRPHSCEGALAALQAADGEARSSRLAAGIEEIGRRLVDAEGQVDGVFGPSGRLQSLVAARPAAVHLPMCIAADGMILVHGTPARTRAHVGAR